MKLTRLELSGFKSFADTVTLTFEQGVTAIVGPNGCGKSNVSDAVRWVLGEQSARLLRGGKMEDVIFQGSTARRPVNVTEVSLYLDNSDGDLPIAYREVVVTRRLSRSGQSDYLLNGSPVRLRDIQDLLRGTGLGSDAGVVIEAKMIDLLLSDRADERRSLFEEAAGIGLYRDRKHSTERRLEETAVDLQRVEDLIAEVQSQIRSLARQRGKAERHAKLTEEKFAVQLTLARRLLERLSRGGGRHGGALRRAGRAAARGPPAARRGRAAARGRRPAPAPPPRPSGPRSPAGSAPSGSSSASSTAIWRSPAERLGQRHRPPAPRAQEERSQMELRAQQAAIEQRRRRRRPRVRPRRSTSASGRSWPAAPRPRRRSAAGWASSARRCASWSRSCRRSAQTLKLARGRAGGARRRAGLAARAGGQARRAPLGGLQGELAGAERRRDQRRRASRLPEPGGQARRRRRRARPAPAWPKPASRRRCTGPTAARPRRRWPR